MRHSFVIYLLFLSLFLTKARGIRLEKGSLAAQQQKQHDQESNLLKRINSADKEAILFEDEQYSAGKIKSRKLVTSSTSTTQDISKNVKKGGNEAQAPEILVNKQQELSHEHYPGLVDIAGMDYSPAKKNTPIHN